MRLQAQHLFVLILKILYALKISSYLPIGKVSFDILKAMYEEMFSKFSLKQTETVLFHPSFILRDISHKDFTLAWKMSLVSLTHNKLVCS